MPKIKQAEPTIQEKSSNPLSTTPTLDTVVLQSGRYNVYYEKSITKNLGNYESTKVTVGVVLPISPTEKDVADFKATLEVADGIVTDELAIQLKDILGSEKK
mgnify:FL=1